MIFPGELAHYGTKRHSGRYPYGSGENPYQHEAWFLRKYTELQSEGKTEQDIAKELGFKSTVQLRNVKSVYTNDLKKYQIEQAVKLKEKGYSDTKIGQMLADETHPEGYGESTVRNWLKPNAQVKTNEIRATADKLKNVVDEKGMIDVGAGTEFSLGVTQTRKNNAVALLKDQGYTVEEIKVPQLGTGKMTSVLVLASPGTSRSDIYKNREKITTIDDYTIDSNGDRKPGVRQPVSIDSKRIQICYAEDGGKDKDGVIELRRGVDDISLGKANYAQVRIAVDGTHYLKGMAMYRDDMPKGVDIIFNTNKHSDVPKMDVLKPLKADKDNPFGATIKEDKKVRLVQTEYVDKDGKTKQSAINVVNEEGDWGAWSKTLSSQFLSKQNLSLIKQQLNLSYSEKAAEFEEIKSLTNPTIKRALLSSFADDCDSSASHLKAAALPRQASHVILPITDMKETEIFAPNYRNGEKVVLVRYPHGGTFEIPELVVNNKNKTARSVIGLDSPDAVGINSKVAERLSGADFDGDTVLVIPTNNVKIRTTSPLKGLEGFDPKEAYPAYEGMPRMKAKTKQTEMGKVSNLITDMTLKGADADEIARAVRHSMVVIDAEKHNLDYKKSAIDNDISSLKTKYQGGPTKGASTLISKAGASVRVPEIKEAYNPDPETGKRITSETGRTYIDKKTGKEKAALTKTTWMDITEDAYDLSSGTPRENAYADYANKLKAMANEARKETLSTPRLSYSPSAKKIYEKEVSDLNAKLNDALKNAPKERQAQIKANYYVKLAIQDNPELKDDHDKLSKVKAQKLGIARGEVGAKKPKIEITDREWEAIQAGAISDTQLSKILNNTDADALKKRATPRASNELSPAKIALIKTMSKSTYSLSEIADRLGVSSSTVSKYING